MDTTERTTDIAETKASINELSLQIKHECEILRSALPYRSTPANIRHKRSRHHSSEDKRKRISTSQSYSDFENFVLDMNRTQSQMLASFNPFSKVTVDATPDVLNRVDDVVEMVGSFQKEISTVFGTDTFKACAQTVEALRNESSKSKEKGSPLKSMIFGDNFMGDVFPHFLGVSALTVFTSSAISYVCQKDRVSLVVCLISGFALVSYGGYLTAPKLMEIFNSMNDSGSSSTTSSQFDEGHLDAMGTLLSSTLVFSLVKDGGAGTHVKNMFKGMSSFQGVKKSIGDICNLVVKTIETITNLVREYALQKSPWRLVVSENKNITEYLERADDFIARANRRNMAITIETIAEVRALIKDGLNIQRSLTIRGPSSMLLTSFLSSIQQLIAIEKTFIASNPLVDGVRVEPVAVIFHGCPGNSKSIVMQHLTEAFCRATLEGDELERYKAKNSDYVYVRMNENDFWSGYTSRHHVIQVDDFLQAREVPGSPSEVFDMIRMINTFPFNLHMDAINEKGVTFCHAKAVFLTTNMSQISTDMINCVDALKRRMDYSYIVVPKVKYASTTCNVGLMTTTIDWSKVPLGEDGITSATPDNVDFIEINTSGIPISGRIDFDTVVRRAVDKASVKMKQFKQMRSEIVQTGNYWEKITSESRVPVESQSNISFSDRSEPDSIQMAEVSEIFSDDADIQQGVEKIMAACDDPNNADHDEVVTKITMLKSYLLGTGDTYHTEFSNSNLFHLCYNSIGFRFLKAFVGTASVDDFYQAIANDLPDIGKHFDDYSRVFRPREKLTTFGKVKLELEKILERFASSLSNLFFYPWESIQWFLSKYSVVILAVIAAYTIFSTHRIFKEVFGDDTSHALFTRHVVNTLQYQPHGQWSDFTTFFKINKHLDILGSLCNLLAREPKAYYTLFGTLEPKAAKILLEKGESQSVPSSGSSRLRTSKKDNLNRLKSLKSAKSQFGSSLDIGGEQIMASVVKNNSWSIELQNDDSAETYQQVGYILMVTGRIALMPLHYVFHITYCMEKHDCPDMKVRLTKRDLNGILIDTRYFTFQDILNGCEPGVLEKNDLCLVELPKDMPNAKTILKKFPTRSDFAKLQILHVCLFNPAREDRPFTVVKTNGKPEKSDYGVDDATGDYTINESFSYSHHTRKGDCGSPVMLSNASYPTSKIFGIHVAGNEQAEYGIAALTFIEDIEEDLKIFDRSAKIVEEFDFNDYQVDRGEVPEGFNVIANVPQGVSQGSLTSIVRSKLKSTWMVPKTAPARLKNFTHDGATINIFQKGLEGYKNVPVYVPQNYCDAIEDNLFDLIMRYPSPLNKRILTPEEAMFGVEDDPLISALNRSASFGYPYVLERHPGYSGKEWFMGKGADYTKDAPQTLELFEKVLKMRDDILLRWLRPYCVGMDCEKDERRTLEKVLAGKTRLFTGLAGDTLMLERMYFGSFVRFVLANPIVFGSAFGVNSNSIQWDQLARDLLQFGSDVPNVGAGDYSRFDGSQKTRIQNVVLNIINRWYDDGPDNQFIRTVLWQNIVNSKHIKGKVIYEWYNGLPSGDLLTTILNIFYNLFAFRYAWLKLHNYELTSLRAFTEHICVKVFGDDNVFSVSKHYVSDFTEVFVGEAVAELGLIYTSETKGDLNTGLRNLSDVSFLKRGFRFDKELRRYLAPLELDVVLEIPLWTKKRYDAVKITIDNVDTAIGELSLHGPEVFNKYVPQIAASLKEAHSVWPKDTSYKSNLMAKVWESGAY